MRRMVVLLLLAFPAIAGGIAGRNLMIPVVGRSPGAAGSDWRSDLVITNLGSSEVLVGTLLHDERGLDLGQHTLRPGQTVMIKDFLRTYFGRETSHGWLELTSQEDSVISASARIYNSASGDFGTQVPAVPIITIGQESSVEALSGIGGNRTNAGITNPHPFDDAIVALTLRDANGDVRATSSMTVKHASVAMIYDVFTTMGVAPFEGARLDVQSSLPAFAFASVVTPSGDTDFIAGSARDRAASDVVPPSCANPAQLAFAVHPAGGWIFAFRDGTNATARTHELEAKYDFTARFIYDGLPGFATRKQFTPEAIAGLRCEAGVRFVEEDALVRLSSR
jgi:hypothetical protein